MRENFLSLNDISKKRPGFQFYTKDESLLELISVKKEMVPVAYGFLGDMYQEKITLTVMNEHGELRTEHNLTNKTNGGDIFNIAFIKKDWDLLTYVTVESIKEKINKWKIEKNKLYSDYLKEAYDEGRITELEMYKMLANEN